MSTTPYESGKAKKKRKAKQKLVLERVPQQQQAIDNGNSKFARCLGSTDFATRDKGVQALSKFLLYKDELPELDVMKLWKGLFFCYWHSDKVPVQAELAERLAGLLPQMHPRMAQLYWAGLLATLRREWFAMDHHRIDKYLMLVRKFVAALFTRLQAAGWDHASITSLTLQLPLGQELLPPTPNKSLGLSYHIADVWLQELQKLAAAADQPVPHNSLLQLLDPFVLVLEASGEQALTTRVKEAVFDVLAADLAAAAAATGGSESDDDSSVHCTYCRQLDAQQLAAQLFERGAAEGVKSRNRQLLYNISKELENAARKGIKRAAGKDSEQPLERKQKKQKRQQMQQQRQQQQDTDDEPGQVQRQQQQQQGDMTMELQQKQHKQQQGDQRQEVPPTKKKKKKYQQAQIQEPKAQQQGQLITANGLMAASRIKEARTTWLQQQQQQQLETVVAGNSPAVAAAAAAAVTPQAAAGSLRKLSKNKSKQSTVGTPLSGSSAAKRGVVINLKKNVYFDHGAPVPPEDIRTPPTAKPKGSALKAISKLASTPAKQLGSRLDAAVATAADGKRKPVTPSSVPRVKAAAFF